MKIPKTWRWCNRRHHLVQIVNDGEAEVVVFKYWLQRKQRWEYAADPRCVIEMQITMGRQHKRGTTK